MPSTWWQEIKEFKILQWSTNEEIFVDFQYNLASLVEAYKVATVLEQQSFNLKYNELNQEEYRQMLQLLEIKRQDVEYYSSKVNEFQQHAPAQMVMLPPELIYDIHQTNIWGLFQSAYAKWLSSDYEQDERAYQEEKEMKEIENNQKNRETVSLIKQALPSQKWVYIVAAVFNESYQKAKQRIYERVEKVEKLYKSDMDFINENEKNARIFQNWVKMIEWGWMIVLTLNPVWWAAIGTMAMLWVWVWAVDLWITMFETADLMTSDVKDLWKIDEKYWTVKSVVWMTSIIFNANELLTDRKTRSFAKSMASKSLGISFFDRLKSVPEEERWYYKIKLDWDKVKIIKTKKEDSAAEFYKYENKQKYGGFVHSRGNVANWFREQIRTDWFQKYVDELETARRQAREQKEREKQEALARQQRLDKQAQARRWLVEQMKQDEETREAIQRLKAQKEKEAAAAAATTNQSKFPKWSPWWTVKYCNSCRDYWMACSCWEVSCKCCSWPWPESCD